MSDPTPAPGPSRGDATRSAVPPAANPDAASASSGFDHASIERPDPALMKYYLLAAALTLIGFPFVIWPMLFKYNTLRYKFDDEGVSMSWGLLFKREIYLTYRRIQDIHVTRNLFHRWLGLADVAVQTASGSAGAEMTIEGIRDPEGLRDFLYSRMRGVREDAPAPPAAGVAGAGGESAAETPDTLALLHDIRDSLRDVRALLEARS
jgi:membrane protein YdbS with pleckstrin-like domain